jgi:hypothetical protein
MNSILLCYSNDLSKGAFSREVVDKVDNLSQAALPDWVRRLVLLSIKIMCYHNLTYFSRRGI